MLAQPSLCATGGAVMKAANLGSVSHDVAGWPFANRAALPSDSVRRGFQARQIDDRPRCVSTDAGRPAMPRLHGKGTTPKAVGDVQLLSMGVPQ
jgi:hypothetical protein